MKNNKDKIVIFSLLFLLLVGIGIYLFLTKNNKTNVSNTLNGNVSSQIETIDWDNYDSNDITLTKSIEITKAGTYTLTGEISNGLILINTDGNVKLILNGVTISNLSGPAIYVENAEIVEIETVKGTTNTLTDGANYTNYVDVDACLFSKDDLILSGEGTLVINANYEDGIVSKDNLKIISGTYVVNAEDDAICGKDSLEIIDGTFTINSKGDGLKSTNDTDAQKGFVLISGGAFKIEAVNDAIEAVTSLIIKDGIFNIMTTSTSSDDSTKGLKADGLIEITGGTFNINSVDDGIHSNGNISINNGNFVIKSNNDGIHTDGLIEINGGTLNITAHEGIEATYVKINDGEISISATDDGINAGKKSNNYDVVIEINGGTITIDMGQGDTDAIDSNGNLYINGGTLNITAQSPFDYDGEAKYTGGTMIINGQKTTTINNQFMGGGRMGGPNDDNVDNRQWQRDGQGQERRR